MKIKKRSKFITAKGDTIIFPVGMGKTPALVAFRIGVSGQAPSETTAAPGGSGKGFQQ